MKITLHFAAATMTDGAELPQGFSDFCVQFVNQWYDFAQLPEADDDFFKVSP